MASGARKYAYQHTQINKQPKKVIKIKQSKLLTRGEKYLYSILGITVLIFSLYLVSFSMKADTLNRTIQDKEALIEEKVLVNESLVFEVRELSQPERITKIAKSKGLKIQESKVKRANKIAE